MNVQHVGGKASPSTAIFPFLVCPLTSASLLDYALDLHFRSGTHTSRSTARQQRHSGTTHIEPPLSRPETHDNGDFPPAPPSLTQPAGPSAHSTPPEQARLPPTPNQPPSCRRTSRTVSPHDPKALRNPTASNPVPSMTFPTPSQLHALHTSSHPNSAHLRDLEQRLHITTPIALAQPNAAAQGERQGGEVGMRGFMEGLSWNEGAGTGEQGDGKGGSKL